MPHLHQYWRDQIHLRELSMHRRLVDILTNDLRAGRRHEYHEHRDGLCSKGN